MEVESEGDNHSWALQRTSSDLAKSNVVEHNTFYMKVIIFFICHF